MISRINFSLLIFFIIVSLFMGNLSDKILQKKYQIALGFSFAFMTSCYLHLKSQNIKLISIANSMDPEASYQSSYLSEVNEVLSTKSICQQFVRYKKFPIFRIAITGGPCGGKSTALEKIQKYFTENGFRVFVVPEVPTIVAYGGGLKDFPKYGSKEKIKFQTDIIKFKIYFQDYITKLAQMSKCPSIILCDRGLVDCAAYMTSEQYQAVLDQEAWTWSGIRDKRYDSVIFLNTAADGAQQFYTLANNAARSQTPQQARALDKKTLSAWIGHPYLTVCPNIKGKPFSYKVQLAIKAVQKAIGLQSSSIIYHKFLIEKVNFPIEVTQIHSQIEQIYLKNENHRFIQDKIKKRGQDNCFTYQRKYVGPYIQTNQFRQVIRVPLNSLQYATLKEKEFNPEFVGLNIKRINFSWKNTYFSIDQINELQNYPGALILRFQATPDRDINEMLPPWIKIIRDVRKQKDFALSQIAKRNPQLVIEDPQLKLDSVRQNEENIIKE